MGGVNEVLATGSVNQAQGTSRLQTTKQGDSFINFKGKKYELTKNQVEQYNELWIALSSDKLKIAELEQKLVNTKDPDDKRDLKEEIAVHKARY